MKVLVKKINSNKDGGDGDGDGDGTHMLTIARTADGEDDEDDDKTRHLDFEHATDVGESTGFEFSVNLDGQRCG